MKKVLLLAISAVAVVSMVSGCSSTHVSKYSAPLDVKIETSAKPTVDVGEKIKGEATLTRVLFFTFGASKFAEGMNYGGAGDAPGLFGDSFANGKAAAAYDACEKAKCDVILAPHYVIEDNNYFVYQKTNYKVEGYKGNFTGLTK
ncbi:MAG: hypothetical protein A2X49_15750 [Lentisphaerae bacterium GWF2_52_8]|nr:MAG: hypothetical protein A2X49_15750 [Lentisphaerae bacterium GWF2_52_8]